MVLFGDTLIESLSFNFLAAPGRWGDPETMGSDQHMLLY